MPKAVFDVIQKLIPRHRRARILPDRERYGEHRRVSALARVRYWVLLLCSPETPVA